MRKSLFSLLTLVIVALLALPTLAPPQTAFAQDEGDAVEVELEGEVQFVGEDFIVVDGIVVYANDVFDVTSVNVTDVVLVTGELQDDGTVLATAYELVEAGDGEVEEPEPGDIVVVVGTVEQLEPDIIIAGYIVAPASAFNPSTLEVGDLVLLEGLLLNDGETIQATSLALLLDSDEEECDEEAEEDCETEEECDEETGEDCDVDDEDEDEGENTGVCENLDHPVTLRLAEAYGISAEQITQWRCDGFGFGQIAQVLNLAEIAGVDPQEIFDRIAAGEGWGNIVKDYDVNPGELAPGRGLKDREDRGNSGNNGNGNNGNNGNGNNGNRGNSGNNGNGKGPKDK